MSWSIGSIFSSIFSNGLINKDVPALIAGFEAEYTAIAHGEGGIAKVAAALNASTALTSSLAKTLADLTAAPPAPAA